MHIDDWKIYVNWAIGFSLKSIKYEMFQDAFDSFMTVMPIHFITSSVQVYCFISFENRADNQINISDLILVKTA